MENKVTPLKAIRQKCLDCTAGQPKEVRFCGIEDCPIYYFRFGKNPKRAGKGGLCKKQAIQQTISKLTRRKAWKV